MSRNRLVRIMPDYTYSGKPTPTPMVGVVFYENDDRDVVATLPSRDDLRSIMETAGVDRRTFFYILTELRDS